MLLQAAAFSFNRNMRDIFKKMNILLDGGQKRKMLWIMVLMLMSGILETMSITMILPLIDVILDPGSLEGDGITSAIYRFLGLSSPRAFMMVMLLTVIGAFVIKNILLFRQNVVTLRFVYTNQFATSRKMMINFMKRPYEYYLGADTAVIQRNITSDVNNMYGLILNLLMLGSELIVFGFMICALILVDAKMILTIASLLVVVLLIIKKVLKPVMIQAGKDNQDYYAGLYKWIEESVMGIKEIKIATRENYFINGYADCGKGYVDAVQKYNLYTATPRMLIETVMIAGMILYLLIMVGGGADVSGMVPQLSVFSMAAMRLLPSANRINNYLTNISYFEPFFMGVSDNLRQDINDNDINYDPASYRKESDQKPLPVKKSIVLKGIKYKYPGTEKYIFDGANLEIPVGNSVGIVGTTGSGKTTIVDILLGLLNIPEGEILADGVEIRDHYKGWLKNIGYIPQMIFMMDADIRQNVAFGVPRDEIDDEKVWHALEEAQLADFVKSLPEGLDTGIGERGIRISGGQRQRIGIARALFDDPEILILDEATSALDNETEAAVMGAINYLQGRKTLIIIAHRLETIKNCDRVYRVEDGNITRER